MVDTVTLREYVASLPVGNDDAVIGDDLVRVSIGDMAKKNNVAVGDIATTGTPSITTFLRGDGFWSPGGTAGGRVDSITPGTGISVDDTEPTAPVVALDAGTLVSLAKADTAVQPGDLPAAPVNADWDATEGLAEILNKPTLFSGVYDDLSGKPTLGSAAAASTSDFATAAQGATADSAVQPAAIADMLETDDIGVSVQGFDADTAKTDTAQTFTKPQRVSYMTLTYGSTVTPDLNDNNGFILTMTGNPTIANPSNIASAVGQEIMIVFRGAFQPSFGSYWKFPGGEAPTFDGSLNVVGGVVISATEISAFAGPGMA